MLCNLSGKAGKFRAIDWLVEHNNLYLKVINYLLCASAGSDKYVHRESTEENSRITQKQGF